MKLIVVLSLTILFYSLTACALPNTPSPKPKPTPTVTTTPLAGYPYFIEGVVSDLYGNHEKVVLRGTSYTPNPPYVKWLNPTTAQIHLCATGYKAKITADNKDASSLILTCTIIK